MNEYEKNEELYREASSYYISRKELDDKAKLMETNLIARKHKSKKTDHSWQNYLSDALDLLIIEKSAD